MTPPDAKADKNGWREFSAPEWSRVIVAGWQPRHGNVAGYWWMEEDNTVESGKPFSHPEALLWHPMPALPTTPPVEGG